MFFVRLGTAADILWGPWAFALAGQGGAREQDDDMIFRATEKASTRWGKEGPRRAGSAILSWSTCMNLGNLTVC